MVSKEGMRLEAGRYRYLSEKLKADFSAIDPETLADTLEGLSDLPQMLEVIVRSTLEDDCLIEAMKARIETMNARLARFRERYEKKRALSAWAMESAGIGKLEVEDFSVSLCEGALKAEIADVTRLPSDYLVAVAPRLDRTRLTAALKAGLVIDGASLVKGNAYIAVRVR
jgi:Siphovirus Gp157